MSNLKPSGEQALINRAREGSVEAFEQLVFYYQDRLYRFLLAHSANRADAEDALQDTFAATFKYLSSYRQGYAFSTWLFTIALRELSRARNKRRLEQAGLPEHMQCEKPGPEQMGMKAQSKESLWQTAKNCLNDSQFTALWLFYVEEMPVLEIAKTMKHPVSWVKVNLMRARRRLQTELQHQVVKNTVTATELRL